MKIEKLDPLFVEFIPRELEDGILYVSMTYSTASHRCCCGCGTKIVTPLSKTDWRLTFDGTVSLAPSIGNWSIPCQSHYWIKSNAVQAAGPMSKQLIDAGRDQDRLSKQRYYDRSPQAQTVEPEKARLIEQAPAPRRGFLGGIVQWLKAFFEP
mgnify:CR=1 FL=1